MVVARMHRRPEHFGPTTVVFLGYLVHYNKFAYPRQGYLRVAISTAPDFLGAGRVDMPMRSVAAALTAIVTRARVKFLQLELG